MNYRKYKLVGMINVFGVVPYFIKPVFKDEEDNLYCSYNYDESTKNYGPYIMGFSKIPNDYISYVKDLSNCVVMKETLKDFYSIGDLSIGGIEIKNNVVYIGTIDKYFDYLKYYKDEVVFNHNASDNFLKDLNDEIAFTEPLVDNYLQDNKSNKK